MKWPVTILERLQLKIAIFVVFCFSQSAALPTPIDAFKAFITNKPTIEKFEFNLKTTKYKIQGLNSDQYRYFSLIYQPEHAFLLIEDRSAFDTYKPIVFWGRYGSHYWQDFSKNDVITTDPAPGYKGKNGEDPFPTILGSLDIAIDALNGGILDSRGSNLSWTGNNFSCTSKIGARIDGTIRTNGSDLPVGMDLNYTLNQNVYQYRVDYEFKGERQLPEFFPSRIKILFGRDQTNILISDYKITTLRLSHRDLKFEDVDYAKLINSNRVTKTFTYTNDEILYTEKNVAGHEEVKRVLPGGKYRSGKKIAPRIFWALFALSLVFFGILLKKQTKRKDHNENGR